MEVAKKHQDRLKDIKRKIEKAAINFKANNKRFHEFQKFVFETAITASDRSELDGYGRPDIEFNITNAPISRLCGEFSKQEPSVYVTAENGAPVDPKVIEVVEGHLRHIFAEAKKRNTQYNVYRDQLSGGFSSFKVWTDYAHEMSFDQVINFGRVYEPTLTGYDPMAREVDKSDASYCFELFPMSKEDFKINYPDVDLSDVTFVRNEGFSWSYTSGGEDALIIANYYEKKKRRKKIVKLADNRVMTMEDYEKFLASWNEQGFTEQPPAIVGEPRWTEILYICRYQVMDSQVLEYKETVFKRNPLVFVDGDSVNIQEAEGGVFKQFTKPYCYHAMGIQKLTNLAGQLVGNDFQTMVMHKFKVAAESLPEQKEYLEAYTDPSKASTLVYQAFFNNNPNQPIPAPQEIARVPLPQEVLNVFNNSMQMLQNILGAYDAALGINDNQLSGVAIVEAATQSNAAAMPYIVNYMQALNQVANIIVDLMPKFYVTPRTIPIVNREGKQDYVKINQPGGVSFNYDENILSVKVEAGVNFAIAKNKALQQIIALMNASPLFAQFINEAGLEVLLDNMEFRNVDVLKSKVDMWLQQKQMQAQSQPNPDVMKAQALQQQVGLQAQKMQQDAAKQQADAIINAQKVQVEKLKADNDRIKIMQQAGESNNKVMIAVAKANAEEERAAADLQMKKEDMVHRHAREFLELHHKKEAFHEAKNAKQEANASQETNEKGV